MSITGSEEHSTSLTRISGDLEPGRARFSKFPDLKLLTPATEKETANPQLNGSYFQHSDIEIPEERSRAKAFCANWQDLLTKPTSTVVGSFSSLDSAPEESKQVESNYPISNSIFESVANGWNLSQGTAFPERDVPDPDHMDFHDPPLQREFSHSLEMIELLQQFRKTSLRKSSEMIFLRKSYSCNNLLETNKMSRALSYHCDFKIYIDGKENEKSVIQNQSRKNSVSKLDRKNSVHAKKVYNLTEAQAYAQVSQAFQASRKENIIDQNRLEERVSSDPFIVMSSRMKNREKSHTREFTDIQWVCLQKLIDEIVSPEKDDIDFEERRFKMKKTLIMTYDAVISSIDLFEQLMRRFFIPSPACISPKEAQFFEESVKEPAQMRVLHLLLYWMREREADFLENLSLRQLAMAYLKFATCVCSNDINEKLKEIKTFLDPITENERAFSQASTIDVVDRVIISLPSNPKSCQIWHINDSKTFHMSDAMKILFDFSPREIAEQFTLIDSVLYKDIRRWHMPHNLRNKLYVSKEGHDNPYKRLIEQTNYRTFFFVYLIIAQNKEQKKISVVVRLLDIAKECVKIQNYQGYSCIMGALTNMAVVSQKIPWEKMPSLIQKRRKRYEDYYKNTRKLRNKIRESDPPLVPCLIIVSLDLEKIMSVPIYLEDSKRLINFRSLEEIALASEKFFSAQRSEFNFQPIHQILEYFQEDVLRLMVSLNSELNITKIQSYLQALALKSRN